MLQPRLLMNGADFRFITVRKISTKEVPSDRIWIVPGIVSFIQDVVSSSDWSSCTKAMNLDDIFFSYIICCGIEPTVNFARYRSLFKSLTLTFLRVPKIPNFIKEMEKDKNSKKTMSKYCWRGFIWADTLLHYMGPACALSKCNHLLKHV